MVAPTPRTLRVTGRLATLVCAGAAVAMLGCGGGTEVAPPTPAVDGDGLAQASLDGVSRGQTEVVSSVISDTTTRAVQETDEPVQFDATGFLFTANRPMTLTPIVLDGPGGPYMAGIDQASCTADPACQYWVEDYNAGVIGRSTGATSPIPVGVPLTLDYEWSETRQSVQVSVSYGNLGEDILIWVHNVRRDETGPFTVTVSSATPPADGSKAYDAVMRTGLLQPAGQVAYGVVADAGNRLDITGVDLSNALNPCIQGHLVSAMTDVLNPDPANPNHLDVTFDDPDC